MSELTFSQSQLMTVGIELELQLINLQTFDLTMESKDFLRRLDERVIPGAIKPEIAESMIEINSSIHNDYSSLLTELNTIKNILTDEAGKTNIGICGGGTHPFQKWKSQRIYPAERYGQLSEVYGYLAKQFTVFGQHIHLGCGNGDNALYLCHAMARYIPHFIALAAASPYMQGEDTGFDCSRLSIVSAFPLSGTPPWLLSWEEFQQYFDKMKTLGLVKSMKDFYWDIRPKPEYGTIELRICDTPIDIEMACCLAAFAQVLASFLLQRHQVLSRELYLTYLVNRFRAMRYGLDAVLIDPIANQQFVLGDEILQLLDELKLVANDLKCTDAFDKIREIVINRNNGSKQLRSTFEINGHITDVVRRQIEDWQE